MSEFDFDEFYASVTQLQTPEAVDNAFKAVLTLPADKQKAVGKALEQKFLLIVGPWEDAVRHKGPRATKKLMEKFDTYTNTQTGEPMSLQEAVMLFQVSNKINSYIDTLLGEDTSPVAKAYNAAAAKLTDAQNNSRDVILKPPFAAVDVIAKEERIATSPLHRITRRLQR